MKQRIQELALMTVVCLVLYYLYWSFADESLIDLIFTDFDVFLVKTGIDDMPNCSVYDMARV